MVTFLVGFFPERRFPDENWLVTTTGVTVNGEL